MCHAAATEARSITYHDEHQHDVNGPLLHEGAFVFIYELLYQLGDAIM